MRGVISTCILAVDANARVYDYEVDPLDTSALNISKLFAELDAGGNPTDTINTYSFQRTSTPDMSKIVATGHTNKEVREKMSTWTIQMLKSRELPVNSDTITTPSEYAAQNKVDALIRELILNDAVIALANSPRKITVQNVSLLEFRSDFLAGEQSCHFANISLSLSYLE